MFDAQSRGAIAGIAAGLGVEAASLLAVAEVESAGRPFAMVNGRPMPLIRWEGHYFYRLTDPAARAKAVAARLAHPSPQAVGNPASQAKRYNMLARGRAIADTPAISSCSWGLGQVMGSHWRKLGYPTAQGMMAVAQSGIAGQVDLMARFIMRFGLRGKLAGRQWASFAYSYNGPAYRKNRYDVKMANAYLRYKTGKAPPPIKMVFSQFPDLETFAPIVEETIIIASGSEGPKVAEMQEALRTVGFVVPVSGRYGPATKVAVGGISTTPGPHGHRRSRRQDAGSAHRSAGRCRRAVVDERDRRRWRAKGLVGGRRRHERLVGYKGRRRDRRKARLLVGDRGREKRGSGQTLVGVVAGFAR